MATKDDQINSGRVVEKSPEPSQIEKLTDHPVDDIDNDPVYSRAEQRKIVHRIDRRLIPVAGLIYCISLIDRGNLPNASIAGMTEDLQLGVGYRYSIISLIFFTTYTLLQPPATVLTRKVGPKMFLATICLCWGLVMIGFGFVQDWVVFIPLRILLGAFEAGYFPGAVYLISTYYSRYDTGKRIAFFYVIGSFWSGMSGVLAFAFQQMDGLANIEGWRWIFIIEGIATVLIAGVGYVYLIDFPDVAAQKKQWPKFLEQEEYAFVLRRINKDRGDVEAERFNFKKWAASGKDFKIWGFALIFFCLATNAYAMSFFLSIILRVNMGYSIALSQCLNLPPYIFACILMLIMGWLGDKYRTRGPFLLVNSLFGITGASLLGFAPTAGTRFMGTFMICAAGQGGIPMCLTYQANNLRGQWKRAFASATIIGFGGLGGVAGSLIFRTQDAPGYIPGVMGVIACNIVIIIVVVLNYFYFKRMNRKADRGEVVLEGDTNFRYTI